MNLGEQIVDNLLTEMDSPIKTVVAIYPGRFQPMGQHHAKVYDWLAKQFGKQNTYIATSNKVALPNSPLNSREKVQVIRKHGIQNVSQEKNVYAPENILKKYNPETTAVVFVYGKKDAGRLRYTKKDGTPGYFQDYEKSKGNLKGYETHGYVVIAPHIELKIPGFGEMSGTTLRAALATADMKTFKDIMGWYDPKLYELLRKKFSQSINEFLIKNNDYFLFPLFTKDVPLKLTKAWFNYQTKHQHIPSHLHDGLFSFVIWLQIPTENKFIFIYNDILGQTKEKEIILSKKDEGTILLFPSKLRHQVYPFFDTDDERISISGNILFETK